MFVDALKFPVAAFFTLLPVAAAATEYPRPELLIEPAELARSAEACTVLDARPRDAYDAGHVPGAAHVPHGEWEKAFHADEGRDVAAWAERIAALGVMSSKPVVVYDDNLSKDAARIWWILRYFGVKQVRLLNGGWNGWADAGLPVSTDSPEIAPSDFRPAPRPSLLQGTADVLGAVKGGSGVQVVDARSEAEHCGDDPLKNARAGAIPGARHLEWSDLLDKETARFKPAEDLQRLFAEAGIDPTRPTVTHCQSGGRASVMAFGLELMGGDRVSNYYRGWSEWGNSDETPVEMPEETKAKGKRPEEN